MATAKVEVMSTLAVLGPLKGVVLPAYEAALGIAVDASFNPTKVLSEQIAAGRRAHILIALSDMIEGLAARDIVSGDSRRDIASTSVGLAKASGTEPVDISSPTAFVDCLVAARSIVISETGASGIFFRALMARLGIADEILAKAVTIPRGLTAEVLLTGGAELAIQQVSELKAVSGVEGVGPLPKGLNQTSTFTAAIFTGCSSVPGVSALMDYLTGGLARDAYLSGGLSVLGYP